MLIYPMETYKQELEHFIERVAGLPSTWGTSLSAPLPQFLKQRYALFELIVEGQRYLGIFLKSNDDFKPAAFEKHLRKVWQNIPVFEGYCVIAQGLPSYVRRRMVERKIPFVDIGQQLFWPEIGAFYQRKKPRGILPVVDNISPATQAVLIHVLNNNLQRPITLKELANKLHYSTMTISRALGEIEVCRLATVKREGRERRFLPIGKDILWKRSLPFLKSPVREVLRIKEEHLTDNLRISAGATALAQYSMLMPPKEPIYALGSKKWKIMSATIKTIPIEEEDTCQVQIWRYDPTLFSRQNCVDPYSLYLSLQDGGDERVEAALEDMMGGLVWS